VTACRLRTEEGEEVIALEELEDRLRSGLVSPRAWVCVEGLTHGWVRLRESPFAARSDAMRRARFRTGFVLTTLPWVTVTLGLLCVVLYVGAERVAGGAPTRDVLMWLGARARPSVLADGEAWRLWTGAFLHRDRWHLGFNVLVLVAVGGALESIYRRVTFLGIVVWGALASALLSLGVGPPVTVGLSGVVFTMLGASVGFGVRFRDVLPKPHQRWFGGFTLAYALFALWMGARSPEVDHAGHLGGLLCGLALGLLLPPRRWEEESWLRHLDPWATWAGVASSVLVALVLGHDGRPGQDLEPHKASQAGVALWVPAGFVPSRDAFGLTAYDNGLDAQVALGCARAASVWPRWSGGRGPAEAVAEHEFKRTAPARGVADFEWGNPRWTWVGELSPSGSWPAQEVRLRYRLDQADVEARLVVFERGLTHCALVLATRAQASPKRAALLDNVRAHVELREPAPLTRVRELWRENPSSVELRLELGLAALQVGLFAEARARLREVARDGGGDALPQVRAHFALGQMALLTLDAPPALHHARAAYDAAPHDPEVALLMLGALRHNGLYATPEARDLRDAIREARPDLRVP
jgi:rhomboid protease GluP